MQKSLKNPNGCPQSHQNPTQNYSSNPSVNGNSNKQTVNSNKNTILSNSGNNAKKNANSQVGNAGKNNNMNNGNQNQNGNNIMYKKQSQDPMPIPICQKVSSCNSNKRSHQIQSVPLIQSVKIQEPVKSQFCQVQPEAQIVAADSQIQVEKEQEKEEQVVKNKQNGQNKQINQIQQLESFQISSASVSAELEYSLSARYQLKNTNNNKQRNLQKQQGLLQQSIPSSIEPSPIKQLIKKRFAAQNSLKKDGYSYQEFQEMTNSQIILSNLEKDQQTNSNIEPSSNSKSNITQKSQSCLLDSTIRTDQKNRKQPLSSQPLPSSPTSTSTNFPSNLSTPPLSSQKQAKSPSTSNGSNRANFMVMSACDGSKGQNDQNQKKAITSTSKEIILQAEIIQLQMKCSILMGIIHKLNIKLGDNSFSNYNLSPQKSLMNSQSICQPILELSQASVEPLQPSLSEPSLSQQKQILELQKYLQDYKNYLTGYKKIIEEIQQQHRECMRKIGKMGKEIEQKDIQIQKIDKELEEKDKEIMRIEQELQQEKICNQQMVNKNEELIIQIQKLNQMYQKQRSHISSSSNKKFHRTTSLSPKSPSTPQPKPLHCQQHSPIPVSYSNYSNISNISYINLNNTNKPSYSQSQQLCLSRNPNSLNLNPFFSHLPLSHAEQSQYSQSQCQQNIDQNLQSLLHKLTNTLQYQLKNKQILQNEILRLIEQGKQYQKEIKGKNMKIYQLQRQILRVQGQKVRGSTSNQKPKSPKISPKLVPNPNLYYSYQPQFQPHFESEVSQICKYQNHANNNQLRASSKEKYQQYIAKNINSNSNTHNNNRNVNMNMNRNVDRMNRNGRNSNKKIGQNANPTNNQSQPYNQYYQQNKDKNWVNSKKSVPKALVNKAIRADSNSNRNNVSNMNSSNSPRSSNINAYQLNKPLPSYNTVDNQY